MVFHMLPSTTVTFKVGLYNQLLTTDIEWHTTVDLTSKAKEDIIWWKNCNDLRPHELTSSQPDFTISTDASLYGWGLRSSDGTILHDCWSSEEAVLHINILELKVIQKALIHLAPKYKNTHCHFLTDTTTMFYINNKGGTKSPQLCQIAVDTWLFCLKHKIHMTCSHIPGIRNSDADWLSRNSAVPHDYSLPQ